MSIGDNVRRYVVNVATDEDDPYIFGPYTQRKAEALAEAFNERIDKGAFEGEHGWIHATAMRIDNPQSVKAMLTEFGQ